MKLSPKSRCADAFSLLEVLTAVAVLSLLVVMLGQVLGTISKTWKEGQQRVNNFTKARVMLDIMARDLQAGVFRSDLAAFPNDNFAFYTMGPGATTGFGTVRNVSLVKYSIDTQSADSNLQRGDLAIAWDAPTDAISFGDTATLPKLDNVILRDTTPGVIQFKIVFVYADGTRSFNYTRDSDNPLRAIGITLAVIDDQTIQRMRPEQITLLRTALNGALTGSGSVKSEWENYLKSGSMNWASYPPALAIGLKIFERYVYLPGT